jgi:hypothetical protein
VGQSAIECHTAIIELTPMIGVRLEWDHELGPVPMAVLVRTRQHTGSERGA